MRAFIAIVIMAGFCVLTTTQAKAAEKEVSTGTEFVKLDPLILPIIDNNGVQQMVSLVIAVEVSGSVDADKVKSMSPKLTDAYIQDMYGVLNEQVALSGGVIQVSIIKERLKSVTDHVMGEVHVNDVLLQVVQQRPI